MQSLLGRSHWDADRLLDEVRDYVVEALGDEDGVLIVDETGFVKKGDRSAGVARQYSGTAGRPTAIATSARRPKRRRYEINATEAAAVRR